MGKAFCATEAAEKWPRRITIRCVSWDSDVTMDRLGIEDKLNLIGPIEGAEKDEDGSIKDRTVAWEFGVNLVAASIVDEDGNRQINTPALREWLEGEISAVQELVPHAMELQRLGSANESDTADAKKN